MLGCLSADTLFGEVNGSSLEEQHKTKNSFGNRLTVLGQIFTIEMLFQELVSKFD